MMEHIFGASIVERDMDLLFLEEFAASQEFAALFLNECGVEEFEVERVIHSLHQDGEGCAIAQMKGETSRGESDMTVIYRCHDERRALLIEDKIDACVQPHQRQRYEKRGQVAVEAGEYAAFDVFLVAPEGYLGTSAAADYENVVSYESIRDYFLRQGTSRSIFKAAMVARAIDKQKARSAIKIPSEQVMDFFYSYIHYVTTNYPSYSLETRPGRLRGSKSSWMVYATRMQGVKIKHKVRGCVDLAFKKTEGENLQQQIAMLTARLQDNHAMFAHIKTLKTEIVVRISTPPLERGSSVYDQLEEMNQAMRVVEALYQILGGLLAYTRPYPLVKAKIGGRRTVNC